MEAVTARIAAYPGPRPSISLGIELANDGDADWSGTVFEPVIPWDLKAWVDGIEVRVSQPALDVGVRPRPVTLKPGERTELASPIVLVFEEPEKPDSPFIWTLKTAPAAAIDLEATITAGGAKLSAPRTTVRMP
jgi:hypothetical protein